MGGFTHILFIILKPLSYDRRYGPYGFVKEEVVDTVQGDGQAFQLEHPRRPARAGAAGAGAGALVTQIVGWRRGLVALAHLYAWRARSTPGTSSLRNLIATAGPWRGPGRSRRPRYLDLED